ncbi:MAG: NADH-quinone oxidoreductase subunit L [Actinobacteria bacterium]|nr:NADH-quinone oxidoreductase subunit L [Actinomycetota bacterium]
MSWIAENLWLTVAVPVVFALAAATAGRLAKSLAVGLPMLSAATVLLAGVAVVRASVAGAEQKGASLEWIRVGELSINVGWRADGLVGVMLVVVGLVALMVMVFSLGYMSGDRGIVRYFSVLSLFTGAMSMMVISDGLAGLFIGWELVGACSYLLIGHWFTKPAAAAAAMKAFLTTRLGDIGLLLGILLLWREVGSLDYQAIFSAVGTIDPETLSVIAVMFAVGAIGKSAQFPLHIWLPDAMEGPTPVSALIHAATMVAAGVFLLARMSPLFDAAPVAQELVLLVGVLTALCAAAVAAVQHDIKKVLAYSTISQLGFMFAALGVGAWGVAIFHLTTHAAFKAMLFLCAGNVIHATGTQDMREMGGLSRKMPASFATWMIGALALVGVFPLSGFFSKDKIVHQAFESYPAAGVLLLLAAIITAYYVIRATILTYFGAYRGSGHVHPVGGTMIIPVAVLAIPAGVLGWFSAAFFEIIAAPSIKFDLVIGAVSTLVALTGIAIGALIYRRGVEADDHLKEKTRFGWEFLVSGFRFDRLVSAFVVQPTILFTAWAYAIVDRMIVDRSVEGVALVSKGLGHGLNRLQNGDTQWYVSLSLMGFIFLFSLVTMWERIAAIFSGGG